MSVSSKKLEGPQFMRKMLEGMELMPEIEFQWFEQKLDHFNSTEKRTWKQRYWTEDKYWKVGQPIFVQFGGEGPISSAYVDSFQMANYGKEHGALLVAVEHRFYGGSKPLPSLSTANLHYLSVDQALADFNHLILTLKEKLNSTQSKVVVFGCSYMGNGAAWFQMNYPETVVGAVASSAPVEAVVDMVTYLEQVGESIRERFGQSCDDTFKEATQMIADMASKSEFKKIEKAFNVCSGISLSEPKNLQTFFSEIIENVMGVVQYVNEGRGMNIKQMCEIVESTEDPLEGFVKLTNEFTGGECLDVDYHSMLQVYRNEDQSARSASGRAWIWQTCTEFGYFQSTDSTAQPFSPGNLLPVQYYIDLCTDLYDRRFNVSENVRKTNEKYHGNKLTPSLIQNTVFDNSVLDPWHTLSIQKPVSESVPLYLYDVQGHCAAIRATKSNDPPSIVKVRKNIAANINHWLSE